MIDMPLAPCASMQPGQGVLVPMNLSSPGSDESVKSLVDGGATLIVAMGKVCERSHCVQFRTR